MDKRLIIALGAFYFSLTPVIAMSKKAPVTAAEPAPPTTVQADTVWVGKTDKAMSCAKERGVDIDDMAKELTTGKIQVLAKKKLHDGQMRIQMCGVDKGDMNGYLISKKDLEKAKELGFEPVTHAQ